MTGIYKITCIPTNQVYIGQSASIKKRWVAHKTALKHKIHGNYKLQEAYNLYGKDNFVFEILEQCSARQLNDKEKEYVKKYNSFLEGFNLTEGGEGGLAGEKNPMYGKSGILSPRFIDHIYQLDLEGKILNTYESVNLAAKAIGGQTSHILDCLKTWKSHSPSTAATQNRERYTHKQSYWIYKSDYEILQKANYDFSQKRNKKSLTISDLVDKGALDGDV